MAPVAKIDPYNVLALVSAGVALTIILVRVIRAATSETPPDPWPREVDLAVKARDAIPVCTNCLYPQEDRGWFCPHCAFPTGEYVTVMPYLQIFATGEVLRRGVLGPPEKGFARKALYFFYSTSQYSIFAPFYWFWMARKAFGKPIGHAQRPELAFEENAAAHDPHSD